MHGKALWICYCQAVTRQCTQLNSCCGVAKRGIKFLTISLPVLKKREEIVKLSRTAGHSTEEEQFSSLEQRAQLTLVSSVLVFGFGSHPTLCRAFVDDRVDVEIIANIGSNSEFLRREGPAGLDEMDHI